MEYAYAEIPVNTSQTTNKRENPVCLQTEITSYMHWSLPLCFILANENFRGWYVERFIQTYSLYFDNPGYDQNYLWVDFFELTPAVFHDPILFTHYASLGYDECRDLEVTEYLSSKIDQGYYVIVYLDEFFIPGKMYNQTRHFVHPSLIYGYDRGDRKFLSIGFNQGNILSKMLLDFGDLEKAFRAGEDHYLDDASYAEHEIIQLFLPTQYQTPYQPNLKAIHSELQHYLCSEGDCRKTFYTLQGQPNKTNLGEIHYGLSVYDEVIANLQLRLDDRHTIDYRAIHVLSEHKHVLFDRLKYLQSILVRSETLADLANHYQPIVAEMDKVKLTYLKSALKASNFKNFYKLPPDKPVVDQINTILKNIREEEYSILAAVCDELDGLLRNTR